jgi:hypothetical protein
VIRAYAERCALCRLRQQIHLPRRTVDLPDRSRIERRYEQFRQAAGRDGSGRATPSRSAACQSSVVEIVAQRGRLVEVSRR